MAILLENATLVTMDKRRPVPQGHQIIVEKGIIAEMGKDINLKCFDIKERIDCSGRIVMPGLVNAHSHLVEVLQRGFRDNVRMEVWKEYRVRTEIKANLLPDEIGAAAKLACAEMLKSGVTAVVDHFSPRRGFSFKEMQAIFEAFGQTGIRGVLAPFLRDQDFLRPIKAPLSRNTNPKRGAGPGWQDDIVAILDDIIKTTKICMLMLGPSNVLNCSDSLLRAVVKMAERYNLGIHTHMLETRLERWAASQIYRKGLGERLDRLGFLCPRLSAAHCVWLDGREMELMASRGCSVVHVPASNLKLGSGIAPVIKLMKHGINVALGTDGGDTSDTYSIFEQMRLAAFLSRLTEKNPTDWVTALDAFAMGTVNGAQAVPVWRGKIGRIKTGYCADLVILKPNLRLHPLSDIIRQIVFCEGGHSVDTVLVNGEVVVRSGCLTRLNEENLIKEVESISERMYEVYGLVKKQSSPFRIAMGRLYQKALKKRLSSF